MKLFGVVKHLFLFVLLPQIILWSAFSAQGSQYPLPLQGVQVLSAIMIVCGLVFPISASYWDKRASAQFERLADWSVKKSGVKLMPLVFPIVGFLSMLPMLALAERFPNLSMLTMLVVGVYLLFFPPFYLAIQHLKGQKHA